MSENDESEAAEYEETHIDRKRMYKELIAKGMSDKIACEKVWPKTNAGYLRNIKEKEKRGKVAAEAAAEKSV